LRKERVIILGAAGRDFHNFNVKYRKDKTRTVVAFTAAQIPDIQGRKYPKELAGPLYSKGIPIYDEAELTALIEKNEIDTAVFAYSDVSHRYVMHRASQVLAAGASFTILGPRDTMLKSKKPVIAVCAVRTGSGKSQTSRSVCEILRKSKLSVVAVRHPMPYGDLVSQEVQRYANMEDLEANACTIEEREEIEPLVGRGIVTYAGVDYEKILRKAEKEADVIVWDGGNNDLPFFKPDLHIVVADPHRAGHELRYHPGEANLRMADVVIINKVDTADPQAIAVVRWNIRAVNRQAKIMEADSPVTVDDGKAIHRKSVVVVEDGPTLTHGGMAYGAGTVAAKRLGAREIVDPRPYAVGSIKDVYRRYPQLEAVVPAMGYTDAQIKDLQETLEACPADLVIVATPVDLTRLIEIPKPAVRVRYELGERSRKRLKTILSEFAKQYV
jgi:predicted GTPase